MTHPKEAVEAVARALFAENYYPTMIEWHNRPSEHAEWRKAAVALLDQIAPLLITAERERLAILTAQWMIDLGASIAAAIRKGE